MSFETKEPVKVLDVDFWGEAHDRGYVTVKPRHTSVKGEWVWVRFVGCCPSQPVEGHILPFYEHELESA